MISGMIKMMMVSSMLSSNSVQSHSQYHIVEPSSWQSLINFSDPCFYVFALFAVFLIFVVIVLAIVIFKNLRL